MACEEKVDTSHDASSSYSSISARRSSLWAVTAFEAADLAGIAMLLIKARIARGWTQRRLADELGVAEQQVQRYETTEYRSASLARICDVATALGIDVVETARLRTTDAA